VVIATPSRGDGAHQPHVIQIELKGVGVDHMAPQFHRAIAQAIALRIDEDEDDDEDGEGDDDEGDDDDDEDEDDSIEELRAQVELLRREVHELGALVRQVIREK
jgi:Ran GTPase-activating protein (RanGAP) involved in mRNA processing and transport